jgi:seryl-tRNA synthetase
VLDQRLLRDNPELITEQLGRRGMTLDLTGLQLMARQERDLEEQRSNLQAEGNRIGKEVGLKIKGGSAPNSPEVQALRDEGNRIKQQVAVLEEEEKALESKLREELLTLPNLPSPDAPDGRSEDDNVEIKRWGNPRGKEDWLEEHWQIAERLGLFETERSVRIAQSRFVTLMGQGARLERALINFMLDLHGGKFNKVELYWFVAPDQSADAHQQITADAEAVLEALELPYRKIELCTGDMGFSATRTYDLEVWLPGAGAYREISSCSVCGDFQARRSAIRMKDGKTTQLLHTLNGSGLAVGRTMAALLENGQQIDGSIKLPAALAPYFGSESIAAA